MEVNHSAKKKSKIAKDLIKKFIEQDFVPTFAKNVTPIRNSLFVILSSLSELDDKEKQIFANTFDFWHDNYLWKVLEKVTGTFIESLDLYDLDEFSVLREL